MKARLTPPIYDREQHYESSSRLIRWVCLALVLLTFPYNHQPQSLIVFTLILVTGFYNTLRYSQRLLRLPFFGSRLNSLSIDHIFVLALVILSGGLASPYYPLFFLLIIAVIVSYGLPGFAMALAGQVAFTLILLQVGTSPLPSDVSFQFIIKIVFLVIFSLVAEQSVRSRDEETLLESRFTNRLENERQRLLSLINSLSSAVLALDDSGKVYLYNAAALELLNTNRDISGLTINQILPLQDENKKPVDLSAIILKQNRVINRQDLVFTPNDGSEMILDLTVSPVHIFGATSTNWGGYMAVFHDITKQKSLDEQRDEFISVASHELRTPLAIAEANLSTALMPGYAKIDTKAAPLLEQAHENMIFLSQLIQDLTTLSRAERGAIELKEELVDLNDLIKDLGRDYHDQAKAKGLKIRVTGDPEAKNVVTSEHEIREILQNFITNAIKYTQKGTVTLALEHSAQAVAIHVKDTGIGISASDKAKIFNKFYRSEDFRTRATGGTGLGLYITKKLAQHMGVSLKFDSRLNHGSDFTLEIPYHVSRAEAKKVATVSQRS